MAKKKFERSCSVCSSTYQYCPNCSDFDRLPRWMDAYCSERCKEIYNIVAGYLNHWLEPEVEAARLSELELDEEYIGKLSDMTKDAIAQLQQINTANAMAIISALKDEEPDVKSEDKVVEAGIKHDEVKYENATTPSEDDRNVEENKSSHDNNKNKTYQNKKIKPKFAAK